MLLKIWPARGDESQADIFDLASQRRQDLTLAISGDGRLGVNVARQFRELSIQAEDHRNRFLSSHNQAIERRLAQETRDVLADTYAEVVTRLAGIKGRLERLKGELEDSSGLLAAEVNSDKTELNRTPFINGNTMRRDVSADYVDQYLRMRGRDAAEDVLSWLLPKGRSSIDSLESCHSHDEIRARFYSLYAADIINRNDRDSLAELIDREHSDNGCGLTDRIREGLQFCLPFWDIRVPGNKFTTEVLMVGLKQNHPAVEHYLNSHAASQRGEVLPQVVPTGQDSVILISRIAHGASYYWHAQDESYFREYSRAVETAPYPVHLCEEWRRLPEPIPDPSKYERRVFALGIAYELIAIRGAAYYLDPARRYSMAATSREDTADWITIQLLESARSAAHPSAPATPSPDDLLDPDNRAEAMRKFIDLDPQVSAVRAKLMSLFNRQGRETTSKQIERYCVEILERAIDELDEHSRTRHQLEEELLELQEVVGELRPAVGILRLER